MKRLLSVTLFLGLFLILLGGCGDDSSSATKSTISASNSPVTLSNSVTLYAGDDVNYSITNNGTTSTVTVISGELYYYN